LSGNLSELEWSAIAYAGQCGRTYLECQVVKVTSSSRSADRATDAKRDGAVTEALLSFMEWCQAGTSLNHALQKICHCADAHSSMVVRHRFGSAQSRVLGSVSIRSKSPEKLMSLAASTLGETLTRLKSGQVLRKSHISENELLQDATGNEWMQRSGFCDVGFVQLDRAARDVDMLEVFFTRMPHPDWETQFAEVATALARVYKMRRPGAVADALLARPDASALLIPADVAILGLENPAGLTPAELRVALLVSRGLSPKAIADELGNSVTTVRTHLRNIYDKTSLGNFNRLAARLISPVEQQAFQMPFQLSA
jgi:DNA-binding CsgD family transcriptional regulator